MERSGNVEEAMQKHARLYAGESKAVSWDELIAALPKDFNPWQAAWYSRYEDDVPGRQAVKASDGDGFLGIITIEGKPHARVRQLGALRIRDRQKLGTLEWETVVSAVGEENGDSEASARLR